MEGVCVFGCTAIERDLCSFLSSEEREVIHEEDDVRIVARIKAMSAAEFNYFQAHRPKPEFVRHYIQSERPWMFESIYLLGVRLGREPSEVEKARDYQEKNASRFRVYYALKHPNNVEVPEVRHRMAS